MTTARQDRLIDALTFRLSHTPLNEHDLRVVAWLGQILATEVIAQTALPEVS